MFFIFFLSNGSVLTNLANFQRYLYLDWRISYYNGFYPTFRGGVKMIKQIITSVCEASSTCIWEVVWEQKFLKMVVENFRQRNIYLIFDSKSKSAMNRAGPAQRDALCHAFQKAISQLLLNLRNFP